MSYFHQRIKERIQNAVSEPRKSFFESMGKQLLLSTASSWENFNFYCSCLMEHYSDISFVRRVTTKEITTEEIRKISRQTKIVRRRGGNTAGYGVDISENIIFPARETKKEEKYPYERDRSLMHELSHIFYKDPAPEMGKHGYETPEGMEYCEHESLIEWKARQWRANPLLLREAINGFNLPPKVYDLATAEAFGEFFGSKELFWKYFSSDLSEVGYWMEPYGHYYPEMDELGDED